ncbi:MAG: pyrroline-5-carboxylate reductase [Pseudomonadota bacterium]|nr:pyrroline-5-carboxylate reductase [Pseudomonadota bacterium]
MNSTSPQSQTPSPSTDVIAFIGGGNMARSLIGGLVARGTPAENLRVAEPVESLREALQKDFGVRCFATAAEAANGASAWLFAVKPQVMRTVCSELSAQALERHPVAISIAAGITAGQMARWLGAEAGKPVAVVRAMPNTPSLIGEGMTGLYANADVSPAQREQTGNLLSAVGPTVWIDDEAQMDAVTAVSGSGPAYLFLLAEAMQTAGEAQGLPAEKARALATQTLLGAAQMLAQSGELPATLRSRVTSPGGTTHAAVQAFESGGFHALVATAIQAATERGRELSAAND